MKINLAASLLAVVFAGFVGSAAAVPVVCMDTSRNYMTMDSTLASSCLDSGVGNLNGSSTDLFASGTDWTFMEKSNGGSATPLFSVSYGPGVGNSTSITGTWSLGASFWSQYSSAALGFKFGTGNTPDEWFVFDLNSGVTGGDWTFFSTLVRGNGTGGLSHVNLYARDRIEVSEPATLALLGLGFIGLGLSRRRLMK